MRLWRLTRTGQTALDGAGTSKLGGRYSPPGVPVVNFASEAGLAVLVALRYLPGDPADAPDDYVLGWTEIDAIPESARDADGDDAIRAWVTDWLEERRSLLAAVHSQVLPEADVVLMNPLHPRCRPGPAARHAAVQLRRVPPHAADAGTLLRSERCPDVARIRQLVGAFPVSPLTDSNRRLPPYHGIQTATGRKRRQFGSALPAYVV
jgi:RES domain-containing protein